MRKIILVNGLIAGAIASVMFMISHPLLRNGTLDLNTGTLVGYTSMVVALSLIFFAIKTYRDQYANGTISFWGGFKIGLLISLIASMVYSASWEVYQAVADPDFIDFYKTCYLADLKSQGASVDEITKATEEIDQMMVMYQNPVLRVLMTMMEIFPVGLAISLIAATLLRKKQILPA